MPAVGHNKDIRLNIKNRSEYRTDWSGFTSETNAKRRETIIEKLQDKQLAISLYRIQKSSFDNLTAQYGVGKTVCQYRGVGLVKAYFDNTDDTGEIKIGEPVVFDTVTGDSITGINSKWGKSEYKRIGISLENFNKVPPYANKEEYILCNITLVTSESGGGSLVYVGDYRVPGRYTSGNTMIAPIVKAFKVGVEDVIAYGSPAKKLVITDNEITFAHIGKRDIRPKSFVFVNEDSSNGLNIATTEFME